MRQTRREALDRVTLSFTPQTAHGNGVPNSPRLQGRMSPSQGEPGRGRSPAQAVTQPLQLPREHFTTSPIPHRLLDGASKAIPGLYFIVTFICKGCQSDPGSGCTAAPCSLLHTRRGTHLPKPTFRYTSKNTEDTPKHTIMHVSRTHKLGVHNSGPPCCTTPVAPSDRYSHTQLCAHARLTDIVSLCTWAHVHMHTHTEAHPRSPPDTQRATVLRPWARQPGPSQAGGQETSHIPSLPGPLRQEIWRERRTGTL